MMPLIFPPNDVVTHPKGLTPPVDMILSQCHPLPIILTTYLPKIYLNVIPQAPSQSFK